MSDSAPDELDAIAKGDSAAFARWLAGRELRLRASLRSFAHSVDTEAIVQEALLRVWQLAPKVTRDGRSEPLLRLAIRVARNLAIDATRRSSQPQPEWVEAPFEPAPRPPDPWLRRRIAECLGALPKRPRKALESRLASAGERRDPDLAEATGMRLNTFLQNVGRARRLLAACLERAGIDLARELT